jgi:hypothetical protein
VADSENTIPDVQQPPRFPIEETWKEMDAFFARCRAEGPAKTPEELARRNAEFLEIEKRRVEHRDRVLGSEPLPQKSG